MLQVTGFRVKHLRSLRDTGWLDLRPITILVGKNSSGKSSLARVFPLLKQSAERRKQSPLLWYGRLVDFGSFAEAVSSFAEPTEIELSLRFKADSPLVLSRRGLTIRSADIEGDAGTVDVTLTLCEGAEGRTQVRRLDVDAFGVKVNASLSGAQDDRLSVDGLTVLLPQGVRVLWLQGVILPQMRVLISESPTARVSDDEFAAPRRRMRLGEDEVAQAISHFVHGNTLRERKLEIADRLPVASSAALLQYCRGLAAAPDTWRANVATTSVDSYRFSLLHRSLVIYKLDLLLAELDDALAGFCGRVSYLEPLRATAQRYYRREELSVDEIDAKGLNTAFFFQGLLPRERESLNQWLRSTFGFEVSVRSDRGHLALLIETNEGDGVARNLADVGLGYSQLLPVAIQLWAARQPRRPTAAGVRFAPVDPSRARPPPLLVVEQPELHLHPAFQGKLADVFVACAQAGSGSPHAGDVPSMRIMAETHSANLVGRLGELVGQGAISPRHVSVLVFETDSEEKGTTTVRLAEFGEDGVLKNWPLGFFDA